VTFFSKASWGIAGIFCALLELAACDASVFERERVDVAAIGINFENPTEIEPGCRRRRGWGAIKNKRLSLQGSGKRILLSDSDTILVTSLAFYCSRLQCPWRSRLSSFETLSAESPLPGLRRSAL
jgi:hypothetical protein